MPQPWLSYASLRWYQRAWTEAQLSAFVVSGKITQAEKEDILTIEQMM